MPSHRTGGLHSRDRESDVNRNVRTCGPHSFRSLLFLCFLFFYALSFFFSFFFFWRLIPPLWLSDGGPWPSVRWTRW